MSCFRRATCVWRREGERERERERRREGGRETERERKGEREREREREREGGREGGEVILRRVNLLTAIVQKAFSHFATITNHNYMHSYGCDVE